MGIACGQNACFVGLKVIFGHQKFSLFYFWSPKIFTVFAGIFLWWWGLKGFRRLVNRFCCSVRRTGVSCILLTIWLSFSLIQALSLAEKAVKLVPHSVALWKQVGKSSVLSSWPATLSLSSASISIACFLLACCILILTAIGLLYTYLDCYWPVVYLSWLLLACCILILTAIGLFYTYPDCFWLILNTLPRLLLDRFVSNFIVIGLFYVSLYCTG